MPIASPLLLCVFATLRLFFLAVEKMQVSAFLFVTWRCWKRRDPFNGGWQAARRFSIGGFIVCRLGGSECQAYDSNESVQRKDARTLGRKVPGNFPLLLCFFATLRLYFVTFEKLLV